MRLKIWFPLVVILFLFTACRPLESEPSGSATMLPAGSGSPAANPYAPGQGDESLRRADVSIDSLAILTSGVFPLEYQLDVKGSLPTPCHQLRDVVEVPATDSRINVDVYSVFDPYKVCAQVLKPFEVVIPLGSYVRGSYMVVVNGKEIGRITP